jgi:hypothetical protein
VSVCAEALDGGILVDYWLGTLSGAEEEAAELHLLGCDSCGGRLREFVALAEAIRRVARSGAVRVVVSGSLLEEAQREGLRVRSYSVAAGGGVDCTVTAEDDLLIARLAVDVAEAGQVDLCLCDGSGVEMGRMRDVPVRAGGAEVLLSEPMAAARALGPTVMVLRLVAVGASGERVMGEYTFRHTPG